MPQLVVITGPIGSGKSTVAALLAERFTRDHRSVVLIDVDDVAAMVQEPGAGATGLWFAAHLAHGALVGQWMRSQVDVVIALGPIYTADETRALHDQLPSEVRPLRVLLDAPLANAWQRVSVDETRGRSRQREFLERTYARFRSLQSGIASDLDFDTSTLDAAAITDVIYSAADPRG